MLLHAAHFGHAAIVELLLEHGADADAGDERGRTYAPGRAAGCAVRCRRSSTLWTRMLRCVARKGGSGGRREADAGGSIKGSRWTITSEWQSRSLLVFQGAFGHA